MRDWEEGGKGGKGLEGGGVVMRMKYPSQAGLHCLQEQISGIYVCCYGV